MFNVGGGEIIAILFIALIVLGPDKLPGAARQVGKYLNEFRRISSGFQDELRGAMDLTSTTATPTPTAPPASTPTTPAPTPAISAGDAVGDDEPTEPADPGVATETTAQAPATTTADELAASRARLAAAQAELAEAEAAAAEAEAASAPPDAAHA